MAASTTLVASSTAIIIMPSVPLCTSIFKSSDVRSSIYPARLRAGDLTKLQLFINLICKLSQSHIQPFSGAFLFGKPTMDRQQHFTVFKSVIQSLFLIRNPNKPVLAVALADINAQFHQGIKHLISHFVGSNWDAQNSHTASEQRE